MTELEFRTQVLKYQIDLAGGVRALAAKIGVSPSYIFDVRSGRRRAGAAILEAFGLEERVTREIVKFDPAERRAFDALMLRAFQTRKEKP